MINVYVEVKEDLKEVFKYFPFIITEERMRNVKNYKKKFEWQKKLFLG